MQNNTRLQCYNWLVVHAANVHVSALLSEGRHTCYYDRCRRRRGRCRYYTVGGVRTFDDEQGAGDDARHDAGGDALVDAVVLLAEVEHRQVAAAVQRLPRRRERTVRLHTRRKYIVAFTPNVTDTCQL